MSLAFLTAELGLAGALSLIKISGWIRKLVLSLRRRAISTIYLLPWKPIAGRWVSFWYLASRNRMRWSQKLFIKIRGAKKAKPLQSQWRFVDLGVYWFCMVLPWNHVQKRNKNWSKQTCISRVFSWCWRHFQGWRVLGKLMGFYVGTRIPYPRYRWPPDDHSASDVQAGWIMVYSDLEDTVN